MPARPWMNLEPPTPSATLRLRKTASDDYPGLADQTMLRVMPLLSITLIVWSLVTLSPLGFHGAGLVGLLLLIGSSTVLLTRFVPATVLPDVPRYLVILVGSVICGALLAFDPTSASTAFAPIIAGIAGYRFAAVPAVLVGITASLSAVIGVWIHFGRPEYSAAFVGAAVLLGMTRRDRAIAMRLAHEKVAETDRAIASESHAQVLAERTRVARDIHDVLAHSLSGVNMQLNLADALLEDGRADEGRKALASAQTMVTDGLVEARKAVYALREERRDLESAIETLQLGAGEKLRVSGSPVTFDAATTGHLVRITGEALTNARRHAAGAVVDIHLSYKPSGVVVEVTNIIPADSAVFSAGAGVGVTGMKERAAEIGADLTAAAHRTPDGHTAWTVRVEVTQ